MLIEPGETSSVSFADSFPVRGEAKAPHYTTEEVIHHVLSRKFFNRAHRAQ